MNSVHLIALDCIELFMDELRIGVRAYDIPVSFSVNYISFPSRRSIMRFKEHDSTKSAQIHRNTRVN